MASSRSPLLCSPPANAARTAESDNDDEDEDEARVRRRIAAARSLLLAAAAAVLDEYDDAAAETEVDVGKRDVDAEMAACDGSAFCSCSGKSEDADDEAVSRNIGACVDADEKDEAEVCCRLECG